MFTPEEIARVATRLFNEHPQAGPTQQGGVPSMGSPTNSGASLPSVPSEVPHGLSQSQAPQLAMLRGAPITDGQMPAGNATPASGSMHPEFASPASVRPSVPTDPSAVGLPTPSASGIPQSSAIPSGVGSFPHGNVPPVTGSGSIISGLTTGLPGSVSELASGSAPASGDGLKRFVQNIRVPHQRSSSGCRDGFEHGFLQKLLSRDFQPKHGARALDVDSIRSDFPILRQQVHGRPLVWFDNAATTQKPQAVIDAISNYYANDNSNIHRAAHTLAARSTDAFEGARQKISQFLGASSPQEIILVRGTTEGINLVANTFGRKFLQPGDEIVLSILEHHANIVPWQMIARDTGAVIRVIPVNDRGEIMMEEYQRILGPRTKLVALAHANNSLGTVLPIGEMIQAAKRYNARVLIDGAQSVSHMPVNVQSLDCDFFVFSGHKLFGPPASVRCLPNVN